LSKPPSAGLWKDQTDEGELGLRYSEIDTSIRNLEKHHWVAEDETEQKVLDRIEKSRHKRESAPHL
jgi:NAD+ synthase